MSKQLDDLTREVSEITEVVESAITLIVGLKTKLDEAGIDPVKLEELSNALDTEARKLAESILANTPSTPNS